MKKLVLIVLMFNVLGVYASQPELLIPESREQVEEPARTVCEIEIPNENKASKEKKKNKPVVIRFNSEYDIMVYPVDLEGIYTWDEAMKASEDLVAFGFDDWYLPSQDELVAVYLKRKKIGNFIKATYWSSTEAYAPGGSLAYMHNFYSDSQAYYMKEMKRRARCVRKVSLK